MNHARPKRIRAIACVLSLVGPVFAPVHASFLPVDAPSTVHFAQDYAREPRTRARINKRTYIIYKSFMRRSARPNESQDPRKTEIQAGTFSSDTPVDPLTGCP